MPRLPDTIDRLEAEIKEAGVSLGSGTCNAAGLVTSPVANKLDVQPPQPDGHVTFAIDGGASFSLGPRLAEVFQFLASGDKDRSGKDGLVGWRSRLEIVLYLEKNNGKTFTSSYVNGMVYLLKKALRKARYDAELLQLLD